MNSKKVKVFLKILNLGLTLGVIYFVFRYAKELLEQEEVLELNIDISSLLIAALLFLLFYAILSVHWVASCRLVKGNTPKRQFLAFFASQPYKYLPSSLFTLSYRAKYARRLGLPIKTSSIAQAIENSSIIVSGFFVAALLYLFITSQLAAVVAVLALSALYISTPAIINLRIGRLKPALIKKELLYTFSLASIAWLVAGVSFMMAGRAAGIDLTPIISVVANSLAYAAGILTVFAPGGIGVREVVLALFNVAAPAIIVWRIITFVLDILTGLVSVLILYFYQNKLNKDVTSKNI